MRPRAWRPTRGCSRRPRGAGTSATRSRTSPTPTRWRSATVTGGGDDPRALNAIAARAASGDDVTYLGVHARRAACRVRRCSPGGSGVSAEEQAVLAELDPRHACRVGHRDAARRRSSAARLMETWAHGLDVRAALGVDRPRHRSPGPRRLARDPCPPLRLHGRGPGGTGRRPARRAHPAVRRARGRTVPKTAPNRITGDAAEYCRVFVQRLPRAQAVTLVAHGAGADAALDVARAYL